MRNLIFLIFAFGVMVAAEVFLSEDSKFLKFAEEKMAEYNARQDAAPEGDRTDLASAESVDPVEDAPTETLLTVTINTKFPSTVELCPRMTISNAPGSDDGVVTDYKPFIQPARGVTLALAPVEEGCLSSGFGPRSGSFHKGVDYHARDAVGILSAGDGTIVESVYRNDYGNMIVIDHGEGVYTRYAHLETVSGGISEGDVVKAGARIGTMGNSGGHPIPRHLHYEVLRGDYDTPKKSFGLTPIDIFDIAKNG